MNCIKIYHYHLTRSKKKKIEPYTKWILKK